MQTPISDASRFPLTAAPSMNRPPHPIPLPLGGGEGARRAGEGVVHGPNACEKRKGAFHEPPRFGDPEGLGIPSHPPLDTFTLGGVRGPLADSRLPESGWWYSLHFKVGSSRCDDRAAFRGATECKQKQWIT